MTDTAGVPVKGDTASRWVVVREPRQDRGAGAPGAPRPVVLTGQEDVPENYHTLVYTLKEESGRTQLRLSQDNCADEDEAEKFSENWQQMLDGIKAHIES